MICECITDNIPFSEAKRRLLKEETNKDSSLVKLIRAVMNGWPASRFMVPSQVSPFWDYRDEFSVYDGIIFHSNCVVIPQSMHGEMLKIIHQGHFGIVLSKRRARDVLFWPGMNGQIQDVISRCSVCLEMCSK